MHKRLYLFTNSHHWDWFVTYVCDLARYLRTRIKRQTWSPDAINYLMQQLVLSSCCSRVHEAHEHVENITISVATLTTEQKRIAAGQKQQAGLQDSRISDSLADLRLQISTLEQTLNSGGGGDGTEQILDVLVKQALFVSTSTLETKLDKLRQEFGSRLGNQHVAELAQFAKRLEELRALIEAHRSDLDSKVCAVYFLRNVHLFESISCSNLCY